MALDALWAAEEFWPKSVIGLSFERPYLMTGLNLMHASCTKSAVNKFADFNEIHGHLPDLNRETSNEERPLA